MGIYILLMLLVVLLSFLIKDKKKYCITCFILMMLLFLFKDPFLGNSDTATVYKNAFDRTSYFNFSQMATYYKNSDVIFFLIMKLFSVFSNNLGLFYVICEIPICLFVTKLTYEYSKIPALSFIMFICLNFYAWSFIIVRQAVAIGFIVWSYFFLKDKKPFKFLLCVLLASLFHRSALIFAIAYPIYHHIKIKKTHTLAILFVGFFVIYFFGDKIMDIVYNTILSSGDYHKYQNRESRMGIGAILPYLFVLITTFGLSHKKMVVNENDNDNDINNNDTILMTIGLILTMNAVNLAEFFRLAMYFNIFGILALPNSLSNVKYKKVKNIIFYALVIIFSVYGITTFDNLNLIPYKFNIFK